MVHALVWGNHKGPFGRASTFACLAPHAVCWISFANIIYIYRYFFKQHVVYICVYTYIHIYISHIYTCIYIYIHIFHYIPTDIFQLLGWLIHPDSYRSWDWDRSLRQPSFQTSDDGMERLGGLHGIRLELLYTYVYILTYLLTYIHR